MIRLYNKKAGERYLSPWMFLIWGMVVVAIVAGILIFYSAKADVRQQEAQLLVARVVDCLVEQGHINENFLALKENFDVFKQCSLSGEIIDKSGKFYLYINVSDELENSIFEKPIEKGDKSFKVWCGVKEEAEAEFFAECYKKKIYALDKDNKKIILDIIASSNQFGKKL